MRFVILALAFVLTSSRCPAQKDTAPPVETSSLGNTRNVHVCGDLFLAGQPTRDDIEILKKKGIQRVITLRFDDEIKWKEKDLVETAGMQFIRLPLGGVDTLTDTALDEIRTLLNDPASKTLLHCGSASRVGGVWIVHRVLNQGVDIKTAILEAKKIGSRNPDYETRAKEYVAKQLAEAADPASTRPGLNDNFLKPDLDVDEWIGRFEVESREVFAAQAAVLKAIAAKPGMTVADIGAGTGLYTRAFAQTVGDTGWVYAVDISPRFLQHINEQADKKGISNLTTVLGGASNVRLPNTSVDVAFVCDTYHHFEFPADTLQSIHRALKPNGELVVIDFERIPGKSRDWVLGHVRAGKPEFRSEIEAAGFGFVEEVKIDGFEENYFLRFRRR